MLKKIILKKIRKHPNDLIMAEKIKHIPVGRILREAWETLQQRQSFRRRFWIANFLFLAVFSFIPNGFSNPLSMLWLIAYYIFWCGFFRIYYHKKPYFLTMDLFGSMVPSTKIFFITLFAAFTLVVLPYMPLLMGFNEAYLAFFEKYMDALQNVEAGFINRTVFGVVLILLSPLIICRPYFACISALQGLNASMRKAFRKTSGNYRNFVILMLFLNLPCVAIYEADQYLECHGWLSCGFYSIFFIYFNLVFAKLYDFFYND